MPRNINMLADLYIKNIGRSVKWEKISTVHYEATIQGHLVVINRATCGIKIDNDKWRRQFKMSLSALKAKANLIVEDIPNVR